jgi:GTPase SAR1 family protein
MAGTLTAIEQYRGVTKVILVGDATVGKSAFLHSYRTNHFPDCESDMPAVVEQFSDIVIDEHGEEMAALLTDTSGNQNARVCVCFCSAAAAAAATRQTTATRPSCFRDAA